MTTDQCNNHSGTGNSITLQETAMGVARRLEFVRDTIRQYFGNREPSTVRILDVGCGTGELLSIPLAVDGYRVVGVDIHEPSIAKAKSICQLKNAEFHCCLLEELPQSKFDVLIASEVLEHLHVPETLLKEMTRFTQADSVLIVTVPNGRGIRVFEECVLKILEMLGLRAAIRSILRKSRQPLQDAPSDPTVKDTLNSDSGHVTFFTPRSLSRTINRSGFQVATFRNKVILNGPFSGRIIQQSRLFLKKNARCADCVPHVLASSWMVAARRSSDGS